MGLLAAVYSEISRQVSIVILFLTIAEYVLGLISFFKDGQKILVSLCGIPIVLYYPVEKVRESNIALKVNVFFSD